VRSAPTVRPTPTAVAAVSAVSAPPLQRMVADSARKARMSLAAGTGVRGDAEFARGRRERVFKAAKRINSCYVIERIHSNKLTNYYFLKLCKLLGCLQFFSTGPKFAMNS